MSADRDERLAQAIDDFLDRRRKGTAPTPEVFAQRHPDLAAELRELLPSLIDIEIATDVLVEPARLPERFGDCRVTRIIGRGGMGVVYAGVQEGLDRPVAIKVIGEAAHDPQRRERFLREGRLAASLDHPHIVPIYAVGTHEGTPFLVMRLVKGDPLDRLVCPAAAREPAAQRHARAIDIALAAARALAYAHHRGVLHRDIKPANLLRDDDGKVWLCDFGLAKASGSDGLTSVGSVTGTLQYMAPEQFDGRPDARSDVYALGLTLLELASGRQVFSGLDRSELVKRIVMEGAPQPRRHDPELPPALAQIISMATAHDPQRRFPSADAFADALESFRAGRAPVLPSRRRRVVQMAIMALVVVVLGWLATHSGSSHPAPSPTPTATSGVEVPPSANASPTTATPEEPATPAAAPVAPAAPASQTPFAEPASTPPPAHPATPSRPWPIGPDGRPVPAGPRGEPPPIGPDGRPLPPPGERLPGEPPRRPQPGTNTRTPPPPQPF